MTKQEEIRGEVARWWWNSIIDKRNVPEYDALPEDQKLTKRVFADELLAVLHSQGVVIKVDEDNLPEVGEKRLVEIKSNGQVYVAVEPLIKEDYFSNERFERGT